MKKTVRSKTRYNENVERNACKVGDTVFIQESKPISRDKRWVVVTEAQAQ
jgi:small subunit ribosomal protein S17